MPSCPCNSGSSINILGIVMGGGIFDYLTKPIKGELYHLHFAWRERRDFYKLTSSNVIITNKILGCGIRK